MAAALYGRVMRALSRRAGVRVFRFFRRELDTGTPPIAGPAGAELRLLQESEVIALCRDPELDLQDEAVRAAYGRGDRCVGALEGRKLLGYCWVAFAPLPHLDGVWVDFNERVGWLYKSFVPAAFRGRGIAPALYGLAEAQSAEAGRRYAVICVESHNAPSIGAARRAGYAGGGAAGYMRRGTRLRSWVSPRAGKAGVRFFLPGG